MDLIQIFGELPFGISSFDAVKNMLFECAAKKRLPDNAKSVISVLFPYYLGEEYYKNSNISRYAVSADYHIIAAKLLNGFTQQLKELYPENSFEAFVDNSPLPEVFCAVKAGLGVFGKNRLFINEEYGSWVFLGEIVTDREFDIQNKEISLCSGCNRCIEACPTKALSENGVNRDLCLSHLSQKKGELSPEVKQKMAEYNCAWGCDICQKSCPMNKSSKITPIKEFFETAKPTVLSGDPVEGRAFAWRGQKTIDRNINAINQGDDNPEQEEKTI